MRKRNKPNGLTDHVLQSALKPNPTWRENHDRPSWAVTNHSSASCPPPPGYLVERDWSLGQETHTQVALNSGETPTRSGFDEITRGSRKSGRTNLKGKMAGQSGWYLASTKRNLNTWTECQQNAESQNNFTQGTETQIPRWTGTYCISTWAPSLQKTLRKHSLPRPLNFLFSAVLRGETFPRYPWCSMWLAAIAFNKLPGSSLYLKLPVLFQCSTSLETKKWTELGWHVLNLRRHSVMDGYYKQYISATLKTMVLVLNQMI